MTPRVSRRPIGSVVVRNVASAIEASKSNVDSRSQSSIVDSRVTKSKAATAMPQRSREDAVTMTKTSVDLSRLYEVTQRRRVKTLMKGERESVFIGCLCTS